jgi:predicted AAA+ superfamily ATPase
VLLKIITHLKHLNQLINLLKRLKKCDKGLGILVGDRGTGKTSMISHISNKLDRVVIFIPNNMIDHTINNPEFGKFLRRFNRPIIVVR